MLKYFELCARIKFEKLLSRSYFLFVAEGIYYSMTYGQYICFLSWEEIIMPSNFLSLFVIKKKLESIDFN